MEWHLTPEYILNNWTDEELDLMLEKLTERKGREKRAMGGEEEEVSDTQFFEATKHLGEVK